MENFAAFFSYVHADDEHDNGRLTRLRKMIADEVQAITGESFEVFQDLDDIHWGQRWEERLNNTLDGTTFLIMAVTPRYLRRDACRKEMERFLEREQKLGRNDLILPILYIETPTLSDKALLDADPLAQSIASRQWFDWRDLRHEPHTNPDVGKRIEKMAREIEKAMRRSAAPAPKPAPKAEAASLAFSTLTKPESEPPTAKVSSRNDPPTLVVDPMPQRGDHTRIIDAIKAAEPGSRILIRPGLYKEALVLDKALELLGDGERSEIIVETSGADVLLFETEFGRVANLTLRQTDADNDVFALISGSFYGVNVNQGRLELEDCDINSPYVCVGIHDGANPRLRRNLIHNASSAGVRVFSNGKGTLEDNDIFENSLNVEIDGGGNPLLRSNRIYDGAGSGITIEHSKGVLENNEIFRNGASGVNIGSHGNPVLRSNHIYENKYWGIYIHNGGGGLFEKNDLRGNRKAWDIDASSRTNVKKSGNIEK